MTKENSYHNFTKRPLSELNLLDNFLFGTIMSHPEYGVKTTQILLETIFHKSFKNIHIIPQKVYYGSDTNFHGARLDVYVEDTGDGNTIYDVEPDKNCRAQDIIALPKRLRFYHSKIDEKALNSGENYDKIKNVIIIMILPFDPLGANRKMYTLKQQCVEDSSIPYDDGAMTILFNTKGTIGDLSDDLVQLLKFIEDTRPQNAVNAQLAELQHMVDEVKKDSEVSSTYMSMLEEYKRMQEYCRDEGLEQGIEKGIEKAMDAYAALNTYLIDASRYDDLKRASTDAEYRQKLFEEFHITIK